MTPDVHDLAFETPLVRARLLCEGDLDLYLALYTDPEVMRYIGPVMGREEATQIFRKALGHNVNPGARARYWHISSRATGSEFGMAALVRDILVPTRYEMGLMLLPQYQNTGVGSPALACIVDGALSGDWRLEAEEITTRHLDEHAGGKGIMRSLGFDMFDLGVSGFQGWRMTAKSWRQAKEMQVSSSHV